METRSLSRQIMGYCMPFAFLILLAVAANGDKQGLATTPLPDSSALSLPHPTVAANKASQHAATSENGKNKTTGKVNPTALEPSSEESTAAAKQPPKTAISTTESSPGKKPRTKPGQAMGEEEMRDPPNLTPTRANKGCGDTCRPSTTTPAATCGSGGLTTSLGIIITVVLSLLLCF